MFSKKEMWRGNVYGDPRPPVCWSWADNLGSKAEKWTENSRGDVQVTLDGVDLVVGFNIKHDVAYLRREGVSFDNVKLWDCQLAEFVLGRQLNKFPSLNDCATRLGLPTKIDIVKEEFWENKCSCYVSIVEKLSHILLNNNVLAAIVESTNGTIESAEMLKSGLGEQLIQISMKLLKNVTVQNLLLILDTRLTHTSSLSVVSMDSHILSMMLSWHKQAVKCVEQLQSVSVSITAIEQEKLEECCADTVIRLLDIWKNQSGWSKHHDACHPNPVDTDQIPWPILSEYAAYDAALTLSVCHAQLKELTPAQKVLVSLMSQDMLILQEMEATGITYDEELCKEKSLEIEEQIKNITTDLQQIYPAVPINFNSGDHLSAFLYGGVVCEDTKEHVGFFKTGAKAGQPKYQNVVVEHSLPRLFTPVKGSELKKEGFYETNEGVLKKLKGPHKKTIDKLLTLSKLEKLNGTYYRGLPALNEVMHWAEGKLHGQLNQTLAGTGRLSASKPNQQNFASEMQNIFVSTYD